MDTPSPVRHTLFWKYVAIISGMVSALLVLSGGLAGYFAFRQSTAAMEELQRANARFAAGEIASFIERIEGALQAIAAKFDTSEIVGTEHLRVELIALLRYQPSITEVYWIAPDGREILALSRVARDAADSGRNWSSDPLFQGAHRNRRHAGPVSFRGQSEPYVSLAASRGAGGAVVVAEVNLGFVGEVISDIRAGRTSMAYVVDGGGHLIAHPDKSLALGNPDLSALPQVRRAFAGSPPEGVLATSARNLEGLPVLATSQAIEHLGWTVVAEQPLDDALRPVYRSIATSVALVVLGLIAAAAASLLLARHMVRPIRQIEAGAREIGEGRLDGRIDVATGDELEALGTQFNRMAARLQEIHTTQEARIAERTHDLALANEAKSRFLAAASHDLRQPVHALALFVGQLQATPLPPQGQALAERIERSVDTLEELFEALLDLSKLDLGAVTPEPKSFALQDVLSRVVADFAPMAEAKGLALTLVPTSLWVRSDPMLLERILLNLVANAIRYTIEGRVLIGCRRRGGHVDLVIADSGVGIEPAHMPHIFEEFYRAGPLQQGPSKGLSKGLGLGLAIVRRLTRLLDHEVTVVSVPGKGTLIRVRIPRVAAQERAVAPQPDLAPDLHGTRVLVVDDEASARDAIGGLLAQWGCEVIAARDGDDAVAQTRDWRPDVVFCDLSLAGGESGVQVADRLRGAHGPDLAFAFITGESAPARIDEARATGHPIAFKPTRPGKLRALIEHLLGRS
jgi:signal transduction histidine kinase/CheY-like chemotaxis protein